MRITRAAKVAAFPLTVLILVALVACQGPAGLAGADGAKGTPGTMGTPGTTGTTGNPGTDAFQARNGVAAVLLNPDDLVDDESREIDTLAATGVANKTKTLTIPLGDYFIGGDDGQTYKILDSTPNNPATFIHPLSLTS